MAQRNLQSIPRTDLARWLSSDLEIQTWRSKKTIQQDVKVSELDTSVIPLPVQNGRLDTGLARNGKLNPYDPPKSDTKNSAERYYHYDNREGTDWASAFFIFVWLLIFFFHRPLFDFFFELFKRSLYD